ncbi:hypothetical protein L873DRAFT_1822827 [Choiromyces venosus 120613-1]|uniref:Uncharacterized protein n=1 Tax=Choiromyces venosus 120613-1 TaxID=1336337 RepID=A0A3N4IUH4_9PEZI|nr:hypothetical protein L873DRAFT_1822827 [Choiromyces venosus 120613-1]
MEMISKTKITKLRICGKAWIVREEIVKFFESQTREEWEAVKRKSSHATNLVEAEKNRLAEYTHK